VKITNLIRNTDKLKTRMALDVIHGLTSKPKFIYSQYFYDDKGSNLFQKLTKTEDYYLTNCEYEILKKISDEIPQLLDHGTAKIVDLIEFGVGDGHKSRLVIHSLLDREFKVNYYPIDISGRALDLLQDNLCSHNLLETHGLIADYIDGLSSIKDKSNHLKMVLFLGSSIGNFEPKKSREFLRRVKSNLNAGDYILMGFDQKKDIGVLHRAYNDAEGITREFNLNILEHINRELGANFIIDNFEHHGFYNPHSGAMESFLISLCEQKVVVRDFEQAITFHQFEPIHLEYSHKYLLSEIESLCNETGFTMVNNFFDDKNYYVNSLWRVRQRGPNG